MLWRRGPFIGIVSVHEILNLHDEHFRISKIRLKANSLNDLYNNNIDKIKDSIRKKDITELKNFGKNLSIKLRTKSYTTKEALNIIHWEVSNTITIKQMIDILSIFYNVEYDNMIGNSVITKLRKVTKEDRYFLRYEYYKKGLGIIELNEEKKARVLKTENNYTNYKDIFEVFTT